MSRKQIRFLIDEDTSHIIRDGLQQRQPEIEIRVIGGEGAQLARRTRKFLNFLTVRHTCSSHQTEAQYQSIYKHTWKKADIFRVSYSCALVFLTDRLLIHLN